LEARLLVHSVWRRAGVSPAVPAGKAQDPLPQDEQAPHRALLQRSAGACLSMGKESTFFGIQPFARTPEEVWSDRATLFVSVFCGTAFLLCAGVGCVSAVRTDILEWPSLWGVWTFGQWCVVFAVVSCAVACVSVWSYSQTKTPKDVLSQCLPSAVLCARSAGILSWACTFEEVQQLTKEPSTWLVEWRTNPFGMHADRLIAYNVAGRTAYKVDFNHLPQECRFVPWPPSDMDYWKEHTITVTCKALVPIVTSHVRMALAHAATL
jgi:hypothetical protein